MLHTMNVVIRKEAVMKYGMRKPNWKHLRRRNERHGHENLQQPMHGELTETIVAGAA